ncbi:helix-turn-helix domain-containing protein [Algoriphagus marincola]|uniref:Helix-turn-helix domain-containing protein n=1 Tax=Algoriphagus marincola TaxID=264027 RepID=A0ABS7N1Q1_9BACT|nr:MULTISPECIES: helix-turn-helix transcriptional regulator [Cytophagales]MBY5950262.1 helix-turn-helix domain-containing protein [Algoriphagus marincola]MCB0674354.1 helix-turn-helix transcriptional regulator [Saprospiraceae bacterium]VXD11362.1 Helix-turn-helix protein [Marinoscillum sp. 108]
MHFGEQIKQLREKRGLLQRQLAASLEIDTPMFSKIERGDRRAKREHVVQLAELLDFDVNQLLSLWLSDQILDIVSSEEVALEALQNAATTLKKNKGK